MTAAEAKNLRAMLQQYVRIEWRSQDSDWPYFRLLKVSRRDSTIKLRGESYRENGHLCRHEGDEFWADWSDVKSIMPAVVEV
jgi:hypothetical protein